MQQNSGKLTALDGVPFVYPQNGKTFDPYFFQTISIEQGTGATVTAEFDYGFGFVDIQTITTNETFIAPNVENIQITSTGADCQFIIYSSDEIGGV